MNRKGAERIVFGTLIGLIIGAIIFATVVIPLFRFIYGWYTSGVEEVTENNFNELDKVINSLLKDENRNEEVMDYYIKDNAYILVGFSSRCKPQENDLNCPVAQCHTTWPWSDDTYHIPAPTSCFAEKSCLCLFKDLNAGDFDGEDNKALKCFSYPKANYLVSSVNDVNVGKAISLGSRGYEDLVIYGECGKILGPTKLQLRKIKLNDKETIIEIAPLEKQ
ncbi:MAG: hypothetical protein AABX29_02010 [Nanoarchaeota archaeon]